MNVSAITADSGSALMKVSKSNTTFVLWIHKGFMKCAHENISIPNTKTNNMARQKGIIKLDGTIGDITFYKSKDGYLAREKGGIPADRIANDPAFQRTRENGAEFGRAGKAGRRRRLTLLVVLPATLTTLWRITGQVDSRGACGRAS